MLAIRAQEQIQSVLTSFKVQDLQEKDNFMYNSREYRGSNERVFERLPSAPYTYTRYTATPMQSPNEYSSSSLQSPANTNHSDVSSEQINRE